MLKKLFLLIAAGIALQLSAALKVEGKFDWKNKDVKEKITEIKL